MAGHKPPSFEFKQAFIGFKPFCVSWHSFKCIKDRYKCEQKGSLIERLLETKNHRKIN